MPRDGLGTLRRILAIRPDNIGDVVLLSPALRALREHHPDASITLLTSPAGSQAVPLLPWVDEVMVHRVLWQDASGALPFDPARETALVRDVAARRCDAAFIFTSFSQSPFPPAYLCYLAGIPVRCGQVKDFGGAVLSHPVPAAPDQVHQAERNLWLLESLGYATGHRRTQLHVPEAADDAAEALLASVGVAPGMRFIAHAPTASCAARTYPLDRASDVARRLADRSGLPVVLVGHERDIPRVTSMTGEGVVSLAGRTGVPELAAVLQRASLLVANDSGPMHIADAFGVPMVVTYAGTDHEEQWRPRRAPARVLRRPTRCSPCYAFDCPYGHECLDIPPDEVVDEALDLLGSGVTEVLL